MKQLILFLSILSFPLFAQSQSIITRGGDNLWMPPGPWTSNPGTEAKEQPIDRLRKSYRLPESVTAWDSVIGHAEYIDGGNVLCMASEGSDIYIGGDFDRFGNARGHMLVHSKDGGQTWSFMDDGFSRAVRAIAIHKGKVYVGGNFTYAGSASTQVNYIATWDGSSWQPLGSGMDAPVASLAFVGDSLFAGGDFRTAGGNTAYFFAVWNGTNWSEASGGVGGPVYSLLASHDSLYVAGNFIHSGWHTSHDSVNNIALLIKDTWSGMVDGLDGPVYSLANYKGHLIAGGDFYHSGDLTQTFYGLGSWDGTAWSSFGPDTSKGCSTTGYTNQVYAFGDSLLVLGNFSSMAGTLANGVAVFNGSTWSALGGGIYGEGVSALKISNGLLVGGRFSKVGASRSADNLAIWNGTTWSTFGAPLGGYNLMQVAAVATNDRYAFFGGRFTRTGAIVTNHIAAWNKQTRNFEALGAGVDGDIYSVAFQGDNVIVGGYFNHAGTIEAHHIAIWNMATKTWSAMGAGAMRPVAAIATDASNIYASIYAALEGPYEVGYIGRWDGVKWNKIDGSLAGFVNTLLLHNGQLYAGGRIFQLAGTDANNIVQYDGTTWTQVGGGTSAPVYGLTFGNGNLYAAGEFKKAGGILANGVAYWDGANWNSMGTGLFGANSTSAANGLAFDGKNVYVAGYFAIADGVPANNLAMWNGTTFQQVQGGTEATISAIELDQSGLYLGGWFSYVNYGDGSNPLQSYRLGALHGVPLGVSPTATEGTSVLSVYPNPVASQSEAQITLPNAGFIRLDLINVLGNTVSVIANGRLTAGLHQFEINVPTLPNGLYFLRLNANGQITSKRLIVKH